jgi:hypothetical protein
MPPYVERSSYSADYGPPRDVDCAHPMDVARSRWPPARRGDALRRTRPSATPDKIEILVDELVKDGDGFVTLAQPLMTALRWV